MIDAIRAAIKYAAQQHSDEGDSALAEAYQGIFNITADAKNAGDVTRIMADDLFDLANGDTSAEIGGTATAKRQFDTLFLAYARVQGVIDRLLLI